MSSTQGLSRRAFMRSIGIAGAGLLVGCTPGTPQSYLVSNSASFRDEKDSNNLLARQGFALNAWLQITPGNDIIFVLDKVEMGQGTMTSHTMMVAEELNVAPEDIKVRFAPPGNDYVNYKFAAHSNFGLWAIGLQMTGSSSSVSSSWQPLREAAATARQMLESAAAETWGVAPARCQARNKRVTLDDGSQSLCYGELAEKARDMRQLFATAPKKPADFTILGRSVQRLDTPAKVDGSARFGIDSGPADCLHAVIIRSPYVTAPGMLIDAAQVKSRLSALAGVRKVILLPGQTTPDCDTDDSDCPTATADKATPCAGIALIADTFWQAHSQAEAQRDSISWQKPGPFPDGSTDLMQFLEQSLAPHEKDFKQVSETQHKRYGGTICEPLTYHIPLAPHATMEPMNCTVLLDGKNRSAEIWAPTQAPKGALGAALLLTGYDRDDIKVHTTLLGGGFGRRVYPDFVRQAVQVALLLAENQDAASPPRAIKLTWSREDDFRHDLFRPPALHRVCGGVVKQPGSKSPMIYWNHAISGPSVLSASLKFFLADVGADLSAGEWLRGTAAARKMSGLLTDLSTGEHSQQDATEGLREPPYMAAPTWLPWHSGDDPVYDSDQHRLHYVFADPKVPIGLWRSVGHSGNAFVVETFIDHLAHHADQDPYEFRRQLIAANAPKQDRDRLLGVLDQVARSADWTQRDQSQGWGIAVHKSFESYCAQIANVSVQGQKIRVDKVYCAVDCGYLVNPAIVESQVESGIIFALSSTLKDECTIQDGQIAQTNFHQWDPLRINECPDIHVDLIVNNEGPSGIGEPGVPPLAPAVANAVFASTGQRLTRLPLRVGQERPA